MSDDKDDKIVRDQEGGTELVARLAENLADVRRRIAAAAAASGRQPGDVRLIAVTKYVGADVIRALIAAGCRELGESRPQDLWSKAAALADSPVQWHLIGHLQRNKLRRTLPLVSLFHCVDSLRLLAALEAEAGSMGRPARVLLEVNVSGEAAKHGFAADELPAALAAAGNLKYVKVLGLMGMAGLEGGLAAAERDFARLRELRDRFAADCPEGISLGELSMGMSGDFEIAIRHGATLVRVGSALFEGLASFP
jgi:pyridoxal phosphate enzyme (YggS family)